MGVTPTTRGFGAMPQEKRVQVAASGGRRAHALQKAHRWTPEQAADAGRKGAAAREAKKRAS